MLKVSDNPPMLFSGSLSLSDNNAFAALSAINGRWWAAHTKARFEKSFAFDLLAKHIGYFLPMSERITISGGKKRRTLMPLFPSYVFFRGDEMARYAALATNRICRVIEITDQRTLGNELSALYRALAGKAVLEAYSAAVVGQRCRITAGPFEGIEGVVVRANDRTRLVLQVGILGQGASMEVSGDLVEPVDPIHQPQSNRQRESCLV